MATRPDGTLLNSGELDRPLRSEAQATQERTARHRSDLLTRATAVRKNPTPMGDVIAAHYEKRAAEIKQTVEWRLQNLRDGIVQARASWRVKYSRFWQLRHENTIRRPSWRVEMETQAWKHMRAEVRRYAELRGQLRDLTAEGNRDLPVVHINQVERVD